MSEIKAFVTVLGSTIIAEVFSETATAYELNGALGLNMNPIDPQDISKGLAPSFMPVAFFTKSAIKDGLNFTLFKDHVVIAYEVEDEVVKLYSQITGKVKIEIATSNVISMLDANKKK